MNSSPHICAELEESNTTSYAPNGHHRDGFALRKVCVDAALWDAASRNDKEPPSSGNMHFAFHIPSDLSRGVQPSRCNVVDLLEEADNECRSRAGHFKMHEVRLVGRGAVKIDFQDSFSACDRLRVSRLENANRNCLLGSFPDSKIDAAAAGAITYVNH